jgi:hypothetical protein
MANVSEAFASFVAVAAAVDGRIEELGKPLTMEIPVLESAASFLHTTLQLYDIRVARFLVCLLVGNPLGALNPSLPSPSLRHLYLATVGVLLVQFAFGPAWMHMLIPAVLSYAILWATSGVRSLSGVRHWLVISLTFGQLIARHLMRTDVAGNSMDAAVLQMILVVKLYTLSYNIYDGSEEGQAEIAAGLAEARKAGKSRAERMFSDRKERSLAELPPLLPYLGYVFNFTTLFVGPSFEYSEYVACQEQTRGGKGYLATRFVAAPLRFLQAVFYISLIGFVSPLYPISGLLTTSADPSKPLFDRLLYLVIVFTFARVQYYAVWKLSEVSCVLAGFGYRAKGPTPATPPHTAAINFAEGLYFWTGYDVSSAVRSRPSLERTLALMGLRFAPIPGAPYASSSSPAQLPDWEGCTNVNPVSTECQWCTTGAVRQWNIHTQSWLERYVFFRVPRSLGGAAKVITFSVSAFWHGFFPGYYGALFGFLFDDFGMRSRETVFEWLGLPAGRNPSARTWSVLSVALTLFRIVNWLVSAAFSAGALLLLQQGPILQLWSSFYFGPFVYDVVFIVLAAILPRRRCGERGGEGEEEKGAAKGAGGGKAGAPAAQASGKDAVEDAAASKRPSSASSRRRGSVSGSSSSSPTPSPSPVSAKPKRL